MTKKQVHATARGVSGGARTTPAAAAVLLALGVLLTTTVLSFDVLRPQGSAHWEAGSVAPRTVFSDIETIVPLAGAEPHTILEGEALVRAGDVITDQQAEVLRYLANLHPRPSRLLNVTGNLLLTLVLVLLLGVAVLDLGKPVLHERINACLLLFVFAGAVTVLKIITTFVEPLLRSTALAALNPVPTAVMLVSIFLGRELAGLVSILLSVVMLCTVGSNTELLAATSLVASLVSLHAVSQQDSERSDVLKAGFGVGLVSALTILAFALSSRSSASSVTFLSVFGDCGVGLANGVLTMIVVLGMMPLLENSFNVITTTKLQELLNPNHALLQKLIREAPGTYHHSVNVAALAEAAAEEVDADPVLAKVAAYYHDLGKTKRPYFFIENQIGGVNYHDNLSPHLSRLIIHSHTKDGVEIAKKFNIPKCITDVMLEHHGTDLVAYFFHRACQDGEPGGTDVEEQTFRYSGPKPQTREAAIVMMADGVEAASRTLKKPTPANVEALVTKIINDHFADGQFNECDITKRDLELIQARMSKTLTSMFHNRVSYPEGFQPVEEEPPSPPRLAVAGK
ncbi:MAG: HDIG domain-containing protein [Candidatus Wallbacteria bacterium]|nr:HDIG domain-containing protein [Candidatus Wallbacteria bacterium]